MAEVQTCASCTRRCVLIHQKKKHQSVIYSSFFKIMFGERFSTVLKRQYSCDSDFSGLHPFSVVLHWRKTYGANEDNFLPPKFAHSVSNLVDEKIDLEDATGQHWAVTSSIFEGSLAFQEGWHSFSQDHGLELGDFVVFHHIEESHFFVQIFKKSGCEKIDFPQEISGKKRKSSSKDLVAGKGSCHTTYNGSIGAKRSNKRIGSGSYRKNNRDNPDVTDIEIVPMPALNTLNCGTSSLRFLLQSNASYIEEPHSLIERDLEYQEGEARSMLLDLSEFEMPKVKPCADEPYSLIDRDLEYQEGEARSMLLDLSEFEMPKVKPCADEPCSLTERDLEYQEGEVRSMLLDLSELETPKGKPCADEPVVSLETQTKEELLNVGPVAHKVLGSVVPSALSNIPMLKKNGKSEATSHMLPSNKYNRSRKSTVNCASEIENSADECDEVGRKWHSAENSSNAHARREWWSHYVT